MSFSKFATVCFQKGFTKAQKIFKKYCAISVVRFIFAFPFENSASEIVACRRYSDAGSTSQKRENDGQSGAKEFIDTVRRGKEEEKDKRKRNPFFLRKEERDQSDSVK